MASAFGPGDQQIGDVGAGKQQHEAHRAEQHQHRLAQIANRELAQRCDRQRVKTRSWGMQFAGVDEPLRDGCIEIGARLLDGDARGKTRNDAEGVIGARPWRRCVEVEWEPDVRIATEEIETAGHHPNNRAALAAKVDAPSDKGWIRAEHAFPQSMRQDGHLTVGAALVVRGKGPSEGWQERQVRSAGPETLPATLTRRGSDPPSALVS